MFEREGAAISAAQTDEIIRRASLAPIEGRRKVLVLDEFHLIQPGNPAKLLKVIEEPPAGTFFVVLVEHIPAELVTIASRACASTWARCPTRPSSSGSWRKGRPRRWPWRSCRPRRVTWAGPGCSSPTRRLALRRAAWAAVPGQLDGTGARATKLVDELFAMIDDAAAPLRERQSSEVGALEERVAQLGERGSGRKALEEVHKRELRRQRVDELRFGLLVLARHYRDELAVSSRPAPLVTALAAIQATSEALIRNPNETLQFQALFLRLGATA